MRNPIQRVVRPEQRGGGVTVCPTKGPFGKVIALRRYSDARVDRCRMLDQNVALARLRTTFLPKLLRGVLVGVLSSFHLPNDADEDLALLLAALCPRPEMSYPTAIALTWSSNIVRVKCPYSCSRGIHSHGFTSSDIASHHYR